MICVVGIHLPKKKVCQTISQYDFVILIWYYLKSQWCTRFSSGCHSIPQTWKSNVTRGDASAQSLAPSGCSLHVNRSVHGTDKLQVNWIARYPGRSSVCPQQTPLMCSNRELSHLWLACLTVECVMLISASTAEIQHLK